MNAVKESMTRRIRKQSLYHVTYSDERPNTHSVFVLRLEYLNTNLHVHVTSQWRAQQGRSKFPYNAPHVEKTQEL